MIAKCQPLRERGETENDNGNDSCPWYLNSDDCTDHVRQNGIRRTTNPCLPYASRRRSVHCSGGFRRLREPKRYHDRWLYGCYGGTNED